MTALFIGSDRDPARRVVVFARVPRLGQVKTRLAHSLGAEAALEAYRALLLHTLQTVAAFRLAATRLEGRASDFHAELCVAGEDVESEGSRLAETFGLEWSQQGEGDLGTRMAEALQRSLMRGEHVVLIGSDCPALGVCDLTQAFQLLGELDLVLSPTEDGGYALIGAARRLAPVFDAMPWSTPEVLAETKRRLQATGTPYALLRELWDVDTASDWRRWKSALAAGDGAQGPVQAASKSRST